MKEKIIEVLKETYGGVKNALQAVVSKRAYVIAMVTYLALSEMSDVKVASIAILACAYIWSESKKKG